MSKLGSQLQYTCCRFLSTASESDFFGISHITSKDISGAFRTTTKLPQEKLGEKYRPLTLKRNQPANFEIKKELNYGTVRLDQENVAHSHGQYENDNENVLYRTTDVKQMFVPLDYDESNKNQDFDTKSEDTQISIENIPNAKPAYRIVDTKPCISLSEVINLFRRPDQVTDITKYAGKPPITFFFDSERVAETDKEQESTTRQTENCENVSPVSSSAHQTRKDFIKVPEALVKPVVINEEWTEAFESQDANFGDEERLSGAQKFEKEQLMDRNSVFDPEENMEESIEFNKDLDGKYDVKRNVKDKSPGSALDYLKQVRERKIEPTSKGLKHRLKEDFSPGKGVIKLDSLGYRDYSNQVIDWTKLRRVDALKIVRESIVYNNYDVIAVNKPYGIASHSGDKQAGTFNIDELMQEIAISMRLTRLHLAHRLDKTTTGVLLFAASESMASTLNKLFKSGQITKTYWCITRGIPDPQEGIINIPIGEFTVAGKARSCLVPETLDAKQQLAKRYREARQAITEYCVINAQQSAALVEVKPKTGVKHQIRCHLGFGLSTPIIGDHKYTEVGRIVPQKLPQNILKNLRLRQPKVRTLPLHLHAKSVAVPGVKANGQTLFVHASLPDFFTDNLKSLKLLSNETKTHMK